MSECCSHNTAKLQHISTRRMAIANGTCVSFCNQLKTHFGLLCVRLWDNRGKFHMDEKRIQCLSNASQHVPIYLQPFTSYSEILVGIATFSYPLHLTPPLGCSHWNSGKKFGPQKTRIMGLPGSVDRLSRFDTIPACDRRRDGQTFSLYQ